jgi:hypothetical protein
MRVFNILTFLEDFESGHVKGISVFRRARFAAETLMENAARRDAPISLSEGPGRLGRAGGAISEAMALGRWSWSDLLHLRVRVVFRAIKATQGGEARVRSSKRFSERNAEVTGTISTDAACIRAKFHQRSPHSCNLVALVAPSANTRKSSNFCKARPLRAEHRLRAAEPAARQHRPKALHVTLSHKPPHTEASLAPMAPPPDKRPTRSSPPRRRAADGRKTPRATTARAPLLVPRRPYP